MVTTVHEAKDKTIKIQESAVLARKDSQNSDVAFKYHTLQWENFCMMPLQNHDILDDAGGEAAYSSSIMVKQLWTSL